MLHKEFWGMIFLAFVAWIFIAGTPADRIKNACRPVGWTGNVVVSLSALVVPTQQTTIQGYFNKFEYGCQFLTWRLFYQEDYNKWLAQEAAKKEMDGTPGAPYPSNLKDPLTPNPADPVDPLASPATPEPAAPPVEAPIQGPQPPAAPAQ